MPTPLETLKKNNLRNTSCRIAVLQIFSSSTSALSHQQIEEALGGKFDRVTVYRTLGTFEEKGILHKVPSGGGQAKYALCDECCGEDKHHDNHVHFKCKECDNVYCVTGVELPQIQLPEGYHVEEIDLLLRGKCSKCL